MWPQLEHRLLEGKNWSILTLVAKTLLKRDARNLFKPLQIWVLFHFRQAPAGLKVPDLFFRVVINVCPPAQYRIVDVSSTPKCFSQELSLALRRIKSEFVTLPQHVLHFSC